MAKMQTLNDIPSQLKDTRALEVAMGVAALAKTYFGSQMNVIWFGSWPKGTSVPRSDIDVALAGEGPLPLDQLSRLRDAIAALPTLYQVDLVDLASIGEELKQEILQHGVRL